MFWLFLLSPVAVAGAAALTPFEDASYAGVALGVVLLLVLIGGLLGLVLLQRHLLTVVDPEPEVRRSVLSKSWFGVIGNVVAVEELLRAGLAEYARRHITRP